MKRESNKNNDFEKNNDLTHKKAIQGKWEVKKSLPKIRLVIQILSILALAIGLGLFYGLSPIQGILVAVTILMGPVFCGWVCPFGTLQDLSAKLGRKLGIKHRRMPDAVRKALMPLRYVLWIIALFITSDFVFTLFNFDPRANFETFVTGNQIAILGWVVIGAFLGLGMVFDRPFCNSLCIEGAKYATMGIARPFTILRNETSCIDCKLCDKACPMQIEISTSNQVRSSQCVNCFECVATCPKENTLKLGLMPLEHKQKAIGVLGVALVIALATTFAYNGLGSTTSSLTSVTSEAITGTSLVEGGDATGVLDGTYTGTGTGFRGEMTVEITVEDETITSIEIIDTSDDAKWLNRAYSTVASEIIEEQTADVDTVSGATYSSMGIKEAVADALVDAGSTVAEVIENDLPEASSTGHGHGGRGSNF